jgi:hypothetical protein
MLAAGQLGAERIIAMSRHEPRQQLALHYGATDIVTERGDEGVARIKELTNGYGAQSVIEAVGTQESMMQAIRSARPGGHVGYVGVAHGVALPGDELFFSGVHLHGGPAPVRRFLPELIELIWQRKIDPGEVFDLELPLDDAAAAYRAMDERRAIKALDDVILAYEMNGEPLPPDSGYPVRVIVPRWAGIASIKWVGQIEVSATPLVSYWNTQAYRLFGPAYPSGGTFITTQPVRSAFELGWNARLPANQEYLLTGRSWSGNGPIARTEISIDGPGPPM